MTAICAPSRITLTGIDRKTAINELVKIAPTNQLATILCSASQANWYLKLGIITAFRILNHRVRILFSKQCPDYGFELKRVIISFSTTNEFLCARYHNGDEGYEKYGYNNEYKSIISERILDKVVIEKGKVNAQQTTLSRSSYNCIAQQRRIGVLAAVEETAPERFHS